jgi:hypothetical protein
MKIKIIIIGLLFIFFNSCDKEGELIDITSECEFHDNILSTCFYGRPNSDYDEFVFRDNFSFQEFGDIVRIYPANLNCDTAALPGINFSKYSLLTMSTNGCGCSATYQRKVLKDIENKKIIYQISINYEGTCKMLLGSRNWAIIPEIPDNYTVVFKLKSLLSDKNKKDDMKRACSVQNTKKHETSLRVPRYLTE